MNDIVNTFGKLHYSSINSAKQSLRIALSEYEDWCDVSWGGSSGYVYSIKK